jgi:hypothetical protein
MHLDVNVDGSAAVLEAQHGVHFKNAKKGLMVC